MSEQPQGPGWWLASDGRYYPPQQAPAPAPQPGYPPAQAPQQYPPAQYPAAQYPPAQFPGQQPARPSRGGGGCLKVALVVILVIGVVVVVGGYFAARWLGGKAETIAGAGGCGITTNAVVTKALGTPVELQSGSGIGGLVSGIIDSRVLAKAPSCYGTSAGSGGGALLVRIASVTGADAKTRYAGEVKNAQGVVVSSSTDGQGGTTTVETSPYYGSAVKGLGDEAFCTTLNGTGAIGVLVRSGDRLLYASVGGTTQGSGVPIVDQDTGCRRAQALAKAVLAG